MILSCEKLRVLAYLNGRGDQKTSEIANTLGLKERFVRRTLGEFREHEFLKPSCLIDELYLGYDKLELLLDSSALCREERALLEVSITTSRYVCFAWKASGSFDYYVSLASEKMHDIRGWCQQLRQAYPGLKSLGSAVYRGWRYFGAKYLFAEQAKLLRPLHTGFKEDRFCQHSESIDDCDRLLLKQLSAEPDSSFTDLAKTVEMSVPGVKKRIQRLRQRGIFRDRVYRTSEIESVERYSLLVKQLWPDINTEVAFTKFLALSKNATEVCYNSGDWNYTVRIEARDVEDLKSFKVLMDKYFSETLSILFAVKIEEDVKWQHDFGAPEGTSAGPHSVLFTV